jgi:hypothetical protein
MSNRPEHPKQIIYRQIKKHWKYQLGQDHVENLELKPREAISTAFIKYSKNGRLRIKKGYAWDGPSGPMVDDSSNMRASLVHDVLYQLMRMGELDHKSNRALADKIFFEMCRQDGMKPLRAKWALDALRDVGGRHAKPRRVPETRWYLAPDSPG